MYTKEQYQRAATRLGVSVADVQALAEIESAGTGFTPSGTPKILFEAHWFSRLTNRKYDKSHPKLSVSKADPTLYSKTSDAEFKRYKEALKLDREAAMQSASWGPFQIMGVNYAAAGYGTVADLVEDASDPEKADKMLEAFVNFVRFKNLHIHLQNAQRQTDFESARPYYDLFFKGYNGQNFKKLKYDEKFFKAREKYLKQNGD